MRKKGGNLVLAVGIRTSVIATRIGTVTNWLVHTDSEVLDQDRANFEGGDVAVRRETRQEVFRRTRRSGVKTNPVVISCLRAWYIVVYSLSSSSS